jgi:ribonuclease HI
MAYYKIYSDGGARGNPGPAACAFVVIKDNKVIWKQSRYLGEATNNTAEYGGVILALQYIKGKGSQKKGKILYYLDSELVTKQLNGIYKVKTPHIKKLYNQVKELEKHIDFEIKYLSIPREKNRLADSLVNKTLDEN